VKGERRKAKKNTPSPCGEGWGGVKKAKGEGVKGER